MLYAIAVGLGYWSHFVVKFPAEWYFIVLTVSVYVVLMSIHYYIEKIVEKEAFFSCKKNNVSTADLLKHSQTH